MVLATMVQAASSLASIAGIDVRFAVRQQFRRLLWSRVVKCRSLLFRRARAAPRSSCCRGRLRRGEPERIAIRALRRPRASFAQCTLGQARELPRRKSDRSAAPAPAAACWCVRAAHGAFLAVGRIERGQLRPAERCVSRTCTCCGDTDPGHGSARTSARRIRRRMPSPPTGPRAGTGTRSGRRPSGFSSPLTASALSRTISAGRRKRGPRASRRFSGSFSSSSGVTREDCRYVADVTISRCIALTSQPVRMNSVASQSSSSGCDGRLALRAEVLRRLHDADAEVHLPVSVHGDARGQRMRRDPPATGRASAGSRVLRCAAAAAERPGTRLVPFRSCSGNRRAPE